MGACCAIAGVLTLALVCMYCFEHLFNNLNDCFSIVINFHCDLARSCNREQFQ